MQLLAAVEGGGAVQECQHDGSVPTGDYLQHHAVLIFLLHQLLLCLHALLDFCAAEAQRIWCACTRGCHGA